MRRIGITCRIVEAPGYAERRDALAHDWQAFMAAALPETAWLPIPNLGAHVTDFITAWGLNGFILSGGETPGDCPQRDLTEGLILDIAVSRRLPVLGVCRGAQCINRYFGGALSPLPDGGHPGKRHGIRTLSGSTREVNSYHAFGMARGGMGGGLAPTAFSAEGDVEAFVHESLPVAAVMWHPERERPHHPSDVRLARGLFVEESGCDQQ